MSYHETGWFDYSTIIWLDKKKIKTSLKNLLPELGKKRGGSILNRWIEVQFIDSDNVVKTGKIFYNDTAVSIRSHLELKGIWLH